MKQNHFKFCFEIETFLAIFSWYKTNPIQVKARRHNITEKETDETNIRSTRKVSLMGPTQGSNKQGTSPFSLFSLY